MKSQWIFVLILDICVGQWNNCFDDKEAQSKEEIKQCFSDNASVDPCIDNECSENSVCNTSNLNNDVACLINFCQKKCKSKKKPCVIECLSLDSCNDIETGEEYMDCIRNSTVNSEGRNPLLDPGYGFIATRYSPWTSTSYGQGNAQLSAEDGKYVVNLVGVILIGAFVIIGIDYTWHDFAHRNNTDRGQVYTIGNTPVVGPRSIPKGAKPTQKMTMTAPESTATQIPGKGMTRYSSAKQWEPQSEEIIQGSFENSRNKRK